MVKFFHGLQRALRRRAFYRYIKDSQVVSGGIFQGMKVLKGSSDQNFTFAHLIGIYEPHVQDMIDSNIAGSDRFVDIGCASGVFTVGVAYKYGIPSVGYDVDTVQVKYANDLAAENGLADKAKHHAVRFDHRYDAVLEKGDFCLVDIEGHELDFIRSITPSKAAKIKFLFEVHDTKDLSVEGMRDALIEVLKDTHDYTISKEVVNVDFNTLQMTDGFSRNDYMYLSNNLRDIHQEWVMFTPKS